MRSGIEHFGTLPSGKTVDRITIANGGARASLITYGASLQDFRIEGVDHPMVLGSETLEPYLGIMRYYGAVVGRVANRIAGGRATIGGEVYQFDCNENGETCLHGGGEGSSQQNWTIADHGVDFCRLSLKMPDGQAGFPGNLDVSVLCRLGDEGALAIKIEAQTDRLTLCNFAHHSYWNLDGSSDLARHRLIIPADSYLPVNDKLIPLGAPEKVDGTRFDFRAGRSLIEHNEEPVDHNFCFRHPAGELRELCRLEAQDWQLTVRSTEPGLQVYDAARTDTSPHLGLAGSRYGPFAGVALEPQLWPDAPNQDGYPDITLRPGETYRQRSEFHVVRRSNNS